MAAHWDPRDFITEVTMHLITCYGMIIKALSDLPLKIEMPATFGTHNRAEITEALERVADDLLNDIPMDDLYREDVRALVIDWLAAADYLRRVERTGKRWQMELVITQLNRVKDRWKRIQGHRDTLE